VSDLAYRSAGELSRALAAGEVSSVELTEDAIARIERFDPVLHAVCVPDLDRARTAASAADAARARGEHRPLLGLPVTVKESFHVAGLPTTWGFPQLRGFVSDTDALAVARMREAGAVLLGKTNVPAGLGDVQSYNDIYGTTGNPFDPGRTPGGSSGGSAAALAAGYGSLSIGSDIAGSLRNPAHFCGVFAHKPTFGLVPGRGHLPPPFPLLPGERDLAVIGPMARTAADLSLLFDVIAPPDELDLGAAYRLELPPPRHEQLSGFRVLVLAEHPVIPTATAVREHIDAFAGRLAGAGTRVSRDSPLLPDLTNAAGLFVRMLLSVLGASFPEEVHRQVREEVAELEPGDQSLHAQSLHGIVLSHREWLAADAGRRVLRQRWRELFAEFDVVVAPIMPTTAFPHDHSDTATRRIRIDGTDHPYLDQTALAGVATLPGLPATALPIGLSGGLPVGVQAIGPAWGDRTTLRFAELAEREFGGFTPPPLS
jgi:amidase